MQPQIQSQIKTSEIFAMRPLIERHPNLFNTSRVTWALRNRDKNGLAKCGAVFESKGGELLIHEPKFLEWFLGLSGRTKPRRLRKTVAA